MKMNGLGDPKGVVPCGARRRNVALPPFRFLTWFCHWAAVVSRRVPRAVLVWLGGVHRRARFQLWAATGVDDAVGYLPPGGGVFNDAAA